MVVTGRQGDALPPHAMLVVAPLKKL